MDEELNSAFDAAELSPGAIIPVVENIVLDGRTYQRHAACSVTRDKYLDESHPFGVYVHGELYTQWFMTRASAIEFARNIR